jgi:hypothetical protein
VAQPVLDELVELLTDKRAGLPTPEGLQKRFQPVFDLSTHEKTEYYWLMRAKVPPAGFRWISADFQPGPAADTWRFAQIELGLGPPGKDAQGAVFASLDGQIRKRLGKPTFHRSDGGSKRSYWRVRHGLELMLGQGLLRNTVTADDEQQVVLSLHVPQGGPD